MTSGDIGVALVVGTVGSLVATFICESYKKKLARSAFGIEAIALHLLAIAIALLPKRDRAEFQEQWLSDLISLQNSDQRLRFACDLPRAAVLFQFKGIIYKILVLTALNDPNLILFMSWRLNEKYQKLNLLLPTFVAIVFSSIAFFLPNILVYKDLISALEAIWLWALEWSMLWFSSTILGLYLNFLRHRKDFRNQT